MSDQAYKRCKCRGDDGKDLGAKCPRLRRSDGSWNPRHGSWYFALELPPGPRAKRRQLRRGGFATRDEALAARDVARAKVRKGADPAVRETLGQFMTSWLASRADLKPTTRRGYALIIGTYLVPIAGHVALDRLGRPEVSGIFATIGEWNAELAAGRPVRKYQRHVGPAAMQRIRACLRAALNDAVGQGLMAYNPAGAGLRMAKEKRQRPVVWTAERAAEFWAAYRAAVDAGRAASPRGHADAFDIWRSMAIRPAPVMVWTPQDTGTFLDYAARHRLSALFELAASTGARRGELCGLRWADVDLQDRTVTIAIERVQVGWQVVEDEPKSESSKRPVALDSATVTVLRRHRKQQLADRLAWQDAWTESGKVFVTEDGCPLHPAAVTELFERLAFAAGLPPIRLHDMRHGAATYALAAGLDIKLVQEKLGHSSSTLTRDVYTSVLPEVARAAAETAAAMIPRRRAR